jgi:siroheme synthase (precorrin-2 oxidase/ferrochelatase)
MARELDPRGTRTLGLITKPDTLDAGSDSEAAYLRLAQNKDVEFRLGWHILKNRDYEMRGATSAERDKAEELFFRTGVWATMDPNHVGVTSLKPRLSNVLRDQILQQLPSFLQDVASEIASCNTQLQRLGTPRTTVEEQRRYLFQVSREFTFLMQAAVDGEYNNSFFGSARTDEGYSKRLRARVQNILHDFAVDMNMNGQSQILVDELPEDDDKLTPRHILRSDYIDEVKKLMRQSRGRELSGTFNPLIISELFAEQCKPWEGIVVGVKETILHAIDEVTNAIVNHVAVDETASGIFSTISTVGGKFRSDLDSEIMKLLKPHLNAHPITYNHYLTDNVEKAQEDRRCKKLSKAFEQLVGPDNFKKGKTVEIDPYQLFNNVKRRTQVDMQLYAGELATDYMEAYYKVSRSVPFFLFLSASG